MVVDARPSLMTVIKTDMIALFAALSSPVALVLAIIAGLGWLPSRAGWHRGSIELVEPGAASIFLVLAGAAALIALFVIRWRLRLISAAFAGERVRGTILELRRFKDRAYLFYSYSLHDREIRTRHFIHLTAAASRLAGGQTVSVAVDPARPSRGFVVELFGT